jgi:hypothetical protein
MFPLETVKMPLLALIPFGCGFYEAGKPIPASRLASRFSPIFLCIILPF